MDYEIHKVKPDLIFIRWHRAPSRQSESQQVFLADLKTLLDQATEPIYFLSDLRHGVITNIETLRRLGELTTHHNWGGGVSYGTKFSTDMYVDTFEGLSLRKTGDHMAYTLEDALAYLESLKAGLTEGVDWDSLFANSG